MNIEKISKHTVNIMINFILSILCSSTLVIKLFQSVDCFDLIGWGFFTVAIWFMSYQYKKLLKEKQQLETTIILDEKKMELKLEADFLEVFIQIWKPYSMSYFRHGIESLKKSYNTGMVDLMLKKDYNYSKIQLAYEKYLDKFINEKIKFSG